MQTYINSHSMDQSAIKHIAGCFSTPLKALYQCVDIFISTCMKLTTNIRPMSILKHIWSMLHIDIFIC